jgi:hypothetical protein
MLILLDITDFPRPQSCIAAGEIPTILLDNSLKIWYLWRLTQLKAREGVPGEALDRGERKTKPAPMAVLMGFRCRRPIPRRAV